MQTSRKVALITGSATGIGRSTAIGLADRGYDIVVNYSKSRNEAEETATQVRAKGAEAIVVAANVADDAAVRSMMSQTINHFGGLNVLVNNAATTHFIDHSDLDAVTEEVWNEILNVNLKAYFPVAELPCRT